MRIHVPGSFRPRRNSRSYGATSSDEVDSGADATSATGVSAGRVVGSSLLVTWEASGVGVTTGTGVGVDSGAGGGGSGVGSGGSSGDGSGGGSGAGVGATSVNGSCLAGVGSGSGGNTGVGTGSGIGSGVGTDSSGGSGVGGSGGAQETSPTGLCDTGSGGSVAGCVARLLGGISASIGGGGIESTVA